MAEMFAGNRVVAHTGARYPIIQAPMTWIARAQLTAAVSAAGAVRRLAAMLATSLRTKCQKMALEGPAKPEQLCHRNHSQQ